MALKIGTAQLILFFAVLATFGVAFLARRRSLQDEPGGLAKLNLNRWLVGLSASTTAGSGFIATGSVAFGYSMGLKSVYLPISWLLGDLVFWYVFPARINRTGRDSQATTLSQILTYQLSGSFRSVLGLLCAFIIFGCLTGFLSAQWLTGQKFLSDVSGLSTPTALGAFALIIIVYSSIGGFRGSIYTDVLLAIIRLAGTIIALVGVIWFAMNDRVAFSQNIASAGATS